MSSPPPVLPTADHVASFLHHLEHERHHAAASIVRHRQELGQLLRRAVPLEPEALARFVTTRVDGTPLAATTRNRRRWLVQEFAQYLVGEQVLAADPSAAIERARVPVRGSAALGLTDLAAVLGAVRARPATWRRVRDEAIFLLFFQTGLRLHELLRLDLEQVDLVSGFLFDVRGKGGVVYDLPLNHQAGAAMSAWLAVRPKSDATAVFVGRGGTKRLTTRAVQKTLAELGRRAGQRRSLHPHELRHAHATALLREWVPVDVIRQSLRHSSVTTTQRYLHGDTELLRAALARLPEIEPSTVVADQVNSSGATPNDEKSSRTS